MNMDMQHVHQNVALFYPVARKMALIPLLIPYLLNADNGMTVSEMNYTQVRRLGGSFGGKGKHSALIACAATVAADKLDRPIRIILDLKSNMRIFGKRLPYHAKYNVTLLRYRVWDSSVKLKVFQGGSG